VCAVIASPNHATTARILTISGVVAIAAGLVLGLVVEPLLFVIALVGVMDLVVARVIGSGRLGRASVASAAGGEESADPAADPSYNPYARED
jgi:hypothetical protein